MTTALPHIRTGKPLYRFVDGFSRYVYPFIGAALCVLAHIVPEQDVFFAYITLLLGLLQTLYLRELHPMLMPSIFYFFSANAKHSPGSPVFSDYYHQPHIAVLTVAYIVICILTFVLFAVFTRKRKKSRITASFLSLLPLFAALIVGGVGNEKAGTADVPYAVVLSVSFSVLYLAFRPHLRTERDAAFVMRVLVALGLAVVVMIVCTHIRYYAENGVPIQREVFTVGWGVTTSVGLTLTMVIPPAFYLAAKQRLGILYLLPATLFLLATPFAFSRGGILFGGIVYLFSFLVYFYVKGMRRVLRISLIALALCGLLGMLSLLVSSGMRELLMSVLDDNGRYNIYSLAFTKFIENPLFGAGFYDSYSNEWVFDIMPHFYHNTYLQLLASTGIFGFLAYVYHRFTTLRMLKKRRTAELLFGMLGILAVMLASLLDVLFFILYPGLIYSLYLVVADIGNDAVDET